MFHYDAARRRVWLFGQRVHHGAGGVVLAAGSLALAASGLADALSCFPLAATGGLLMAHDWHDRAIWFERGYGSQP